MIGNITLEEPNYNCILPYEIPAEKWVWYDVYSWWLEGFGPLFIGSIGILLNMTTVVVLIGTRLCASFFNWLLVCLSLFDSLFLINGMLEASRYHVEKNSYLHNYIFVKFVYPFRSVVMFCSMYMTVILALERYNALARPTSSQSSNVGSKKLNALVYFKKHWLRLLRYVGPVVLLSAVFCSPKYLELYLKQDEQCSTTVQNLSCSQHTIGLTDLRKSGDYVLWYINIMNLIVTTVVPFVALAYLNFNTYLKLNQYIHRQPSYRISLNSRQNHQLATQSDYKGVQERPRKQEKHAVHQTLILFGIVIVFIISHVLRIILNIEELNSLGEERKAQEKGCDWLKFWTIIVAPISNLVLQMNSGINFFIYCFFNPSFRKVVISSLCVLFRCNGCNGRRKAVITNHDKETKNIAKKESKIVQERATLNENPTENYRIRIQSNKMNNIRGVWKGWLAPLQHH